MFTIICHQGNENQNHIEILLILTRMAKIKREAITNVSEDVENWNPHALLVGMYMVTCFEKQFWQFLQKLNIGLPYDPVISILGIYMPKRSETYILI